MMLAPLIAILAAGQAHGTNGLELADLPSYAVALKPGPGARPVPATFPELWARPESLRGRRVEVTGRVARLFRAPASGTLPDRVEIWLSQGRNLICTVVPDWPDCDLEAREGRLLAVAGTSLGLVRYASGDVERLAPLVVGPGTPRPIDDPKTRHDLADWSTSAWTLAAIGALVVAGFLSRAHAKRPPRPRPDPSEPVEFLS